MPIRQSERARYPSNWKQISAKVREEAGQKCEQCKAPNGEEVLRQQSEDWNFEPSYMVRTGDVYSAKDGKYLGWDHAPDADGNWVRIVLTVAHLDHQPENCARDNLKALCQRCHLAYDAAHHAKNAAETRRKRKASADLFDI